MDGVQASQEQGTTATSPLPRTTALDHANTTSEGESTLSELDSSSDGAADSMAASTQKRWLTQPNSKIAKADLVAILRQEDAWESLPEEARQNLYNLLPPPTGGEPPHNIDVHPLQTQYKQHIEEGIRTWQNDLKDGREVKSWREQAMQVEEDRKEGKLDDFKAYQREADWGTDGEEENESDGKKKAVEKKEGESKDLKNGTNGKVADAAAVEDGDDAEGDEIEVKPKSYLTKGQKLAARKVVADSEEDTAPES
ncbi:hypothetical protein PRZ48_004157 [Zasmidium cellare]|uniref:ASX DEUBAD domain-containing protein n=1 Tax=Zasmidium cellare TaxID=395010 RepID=A0ABR0EX30_ZASCE|nr:hypothetical protein PRZ48_004157 [Zasmidium cellare]